MIIGGPGSRREPTHDFLKDFRVAEPSAVDQLAAMHDPEGEAAQKVRDYAEWCARVKKLAAMPTLNYERVTLDNL